MKVVAKFMIFLSVFMVLCISNTKSYAELIGYYDDEHTRDDGYQSSDINYLTNSGYMAGNSTRYKGGAVGLGNTSWVYDIPKATQHKVGYYDAEHTKADGYQDSHIDSIRESGYAVGYSKMYLAEPEIAVKGGLGYVGQTAWIYDVPKSTHYKVGFYDAEHTGDNGYRYSKVSDFAEDVYVAGYSKRYNGGDTELGQTAWVYDIPKATHQEIGFYDAEHTRDSGEQISYVNNINKVGYVGGYSIRYNGGAVNLGQTAWVYDMPKTTQHKIGFYDAEHTQDSGYKYSAAAILSESGYVGGQSRRYNGGAFELGQTAWVYDISKSTHYKVGYYDVEHTSSTGVKNSGISSLKESGYVGGYSTRYNGGGINLGQTAWIYDIPKSTHYKVGFYDAEHTRDNGHQYSAANILSESGYAIGVSKRYNGGALDLGQTTWVYDISKSTHYKTGFYDAEHTNSNGFKYSQIYTLSESGYARGSSYRYNGGALHLGDTAWVYDITNTTQHKVGLYDAEHTRNDGYKKSWSDDLRESGYVTGYSKRYNGGAVDLGETAWVYDISNTRLNEIGIYDAKHTKDDGYQSTSISSVVESGYVTGYSKRYNGGAAELGQTAWLYHAPTNRMASFDFGTDIVTNEGYTRPKYLSSQGVVYGTFGHIGSNGRIDGERVFKGMIDGTKVDLFEAAGGEILKYHFRPDAMIIGAWENLGGDIVVGLGQLWTDYHDNDSILSFALLFDNPVEGKAETKNQKAMAKAIGGSEGSPVSYVGPYAVFFQYLMNNMSGDNASSVLQSMIPQADSYARLVGRTGMRLVMDTVTQNNFNTLGFIGGVEGNTQSKLNQSTSGFAKEDITLYGKYIYSKGSQNGDVDNNGYEFNSHGVNFGADLISGDKGIWGVSIGFLETDIDGEQNTGDIDQTSFSPSIYAGFTKDKWKITAGLGYGFQKNDSNRFSGISEVGTVKADWNAHAYSVFSTAAYNLKQTKDYSLDAVIGFDYIMLHEEEYTEKSGDLWDMVIDSKTSDTLRSRLGLRVLKDNKFKNGLKLKSEVRSFWLHDYLNEASTAVNSFNGSNSFTIEGLGLDRDRLQLGFTLDLLFTDKTSLFLRYDTEISENADRHEINTGLKYNF